MTFRDIFVVVKLSLLQDRNTCVWKRGPGTIRVAESRVVDTRYWSKLRDEERCNVDLSQNVSWMSNQEGLDERVTFSADVLEAVYMLEY
jgi:hypothetical protein